MKHADPPARMRVRLLQALVVVATVGFVIFFFLNQTVVSVPPPLPETKSPDRMVPPPDTEPPANAPLQRYAGVTAADFKKGTPPLSKVYMPFKDLCAVGSEQHYKDLAMERAVTQGHNASSSWAAYTARQARKQQLANLTSRFDRVPATGGASAVRWSAATGLPVATNRSGTVKVRFMTSSNRLGVFEQTATTAAAMVGVRFEVIGMGWKHFSFLKRIGMMLSYAAVENMTDADVIVGLDSDALFSGEDPYSFYEAFVASTAESAAEHREYGVRDIRFGKRMAPIVFGAEFNCMRVQGQAPGEPCNLKPNQINARAAQWAKERSVVLPTFYTDKNPFRFLNAGVFVARVWALKLFNAGLQEFIRHHNPKQNRKYWWCDQSAMASLYLDLLQWELLSESLDGAPKPLTAAQLNSSFYPPMMLPSRLDGPHGLPGGLIGIDGTEQLVLTVTPEMSHMRFFRIADVGVGTNTDPEHPLLEFQARDNTSHVNSKITNRSSKRTESRTTQTSITGVRESTHRLNVRPRDGVDCAKDVPNRPPECAYRDAVLGIPSNATAVVPLMWHFAGERKENIVVHFRGIFPWYTPTINSREALRKVLETLLDAPPTRVFRIDNATDVTESYQQAKLQPHSASDDLTFLEMCAIAAAQTTQAPKH